MEKLPAIVARCADRWALTVAPPFPNLTYNYVAPAIRNDGTHVILKVAFPANEFVQEAEALRLFAGRGSASLLDVYYADSCMLQEQLRPGTSLLTILDDRETTSIAASVMRVLWREVPGEHCFPTVATWGAAFSDIRRVFGGGTGPLPPSTVERGERLYAELVGTSANPMVLHGDLHHDNILSAERSPWLAIDPKGIVGEPVYETGAWLRNWLPDLLHEPNPKSILSRRIDQFASELGFDRTRIRDWAVAQAILSAIWTVQEGRGNWHDAIDCAEILSTING